MLRQRFLLVLALLLGGTLAAGCMPEKADTGDEASGEQQPQVYQQSEGTPALSASGAKNDLSVTKKGPRRMPDKLRLRNAASKKRLQPREVKLTEEEQKAAIAALPVHPDAAPRITAAEPVFDYGEVAQGTSVKHTFTIKNIGKNPLVIERAEGG